MQNECPGNGSVDSCEGNFRGRRQVFGESLKEDYHRRKKDKEALFIVPYLKQTT